MAEYDVTPPPERLDDRVQIRTAFSTERGEVIELLVQLEYWIESEWRVVVRYDHDSEAVGGHDVTAEGLHRDVFRDGTKKRTKSITGPTSAARGLEYAEDDLRVTLERYIKRFERWHDVDH